MQFPVNKNIDAYKDDFFRGLSMRESVTAGAMVVSGVISFLFFYMYMGLPHTISMYCMLPLPGSIGVAGFFRVRGKSLWEYIRGRRRVTEMPVYYFSPAMLDMCSDEEGKGSVPGKGSRREKQQAADEKGVLSE